MPLLESSDGPQRPGEKHPRGACYWCWYWSQPERRGFENFEQGVATIDDVGIAQQWLGKLNELEASVENKEAVVDRIKELQG